MAPWYFRNICKSNHLVTLRSHWGFQRTNLKNILSFSFTYLQADNREYRISTSFTSEIKTLWEIRISNLQFCMWKGVDCFIIRVQYSSHISHIVKWSLFTPANRQSSVADSPEGGLDCLVAFSKSSKVTPFTQNKALFKKRSTCSFRPWWYLWFPFLLRFHLPSLSSTDATFEIIEASFLSPTN